MPASTESSVSPARVVQLWERLILRTQRQLRIRPRAFCLITGAPRSGTTALCNWLTAQQGATGGPETRVLVAAHRLVQEIDRFRRLKQREKALLAGTRRFVEESYAGMFPLWGRILIDKEPLGPLAHPDRAYEEFLRNVRRIFPEMKLIFMIRAPVNSIWSMNRRTWGYSLTEGERYTLPLETLIDTWSAAAEVAVALHQDPNVYLCRFERLITQPERESQKIRRFLGLQEGPAFATKPTKEPGFTPEERDHLVRATRESWIRLLPVAGMDGESADPSPLTR